MNPCVRMERGDNANIRKGEGDYVHEEERRSGRAAAAKDPGYQTDRVGWKRSVRSVYQSVQSCLHRSEKVSLPRSLYADIFNTFDVKITRVKVIVILFPSIEKTPIIIDKTDWTMP